MPPSQRSTMEHSPTSRCCSSCMDRALWKGWGSCGDGSREQILGWGEGEWTEAASGDKDAVSLAFILIGCTQKVGQPGVRGVGAAGGQLGMAQRSQARGIWGWAWRLWRPKRTGCDNLD